MSTTRKVRVIKQTNPLEGNRDTYKDRHEKSLIDILVPEHIEYTRQVIEKASRRVSVQPVQELRECAEF